MSTAIIKKFPTAALAAATLALTACSPDGIDAAVDITNYEIVTLGQNTPDSSTFELIGPDNTGSELLHASRGLDPQQFSDGDRLIIAYTPAGGSSSGAINLRSAIRIFNGQMRQDDPDAFSQTSDPVYLMAMWRTGPYLNIRAMLPASSQPRTWRLVADPATTATETPRLRLIHRLPDGLDPGSTYMSPTYSSFDIGAITTSPTATSFTVEVDNSNLTSLNKLTFNIK